MICARCGGTDELARVRILVEERERAAWEVCGACQGFVVDLMVAGMEASRYVPPREPARPSDD